MKGGSPKLVRGSRPMMEAVKGTDFEGLDLLPADFTYRHMDIDLNGRPKPQRTLRRLLAPLSSEYDRVILDTPPSLSLVSENVIRAADVVLVPLIPTVLSVRTFDQLADFIDHLKGRKPALRGFFSMLDRRRKLHKEILATLPAERDQMSTVAIPSASAVEQMAVRRAPLMVFAPRSPAALAFQQLWDEIDQYKVAVERWHPGLALGLDPVPRDSGTARRAALYPAWSTEPRAASSPAATSFRVGEMASGSPDWSSSSTRPRDARTASRRVRVPVRVTSSGAEASSTVSRSSTAATRFAPTVQPPST